MIQEKKKKNIYNVSAIILILIRQQIALSVPIAEIMNKQMH